MGAVTSRSVLFQRIAQGLGFSGAYAAASGAGTGTVTSAQGFIVLSPLFNRLGSTLPGTRQGLPLPAGLPGPLRLVEARTMFDSGTGAFGFWLARLYELGTVDLTATGDKFTRTAGTFPLTRTQFGVATDPLPLLLLAYVTTAVGTPAAVVRLRTAAGGSGYTNQSGSTVVGANTLTFAAGTVAQTCYAFPLEQGDSAVRDISAVEVTTLSSTGALLMLAAELLAPVPALLRVPIIADSLFGGLSLPDIAPAPTTSGSVTSHLALLGHTSGGATEIDMSLTAVLDT